MPWDARTRIGILLGGLVVATLLVLIDVVGPVFFGVTVAYILTPLYVRLRQWGASDKIAAGIVTISAFGGLGVLFAPLGFVLYQQRIRILDVLESLPAEISLALGDVTYVIVTSDMIQLIAHWVTRAATNVIASLPVLTAKTVVFGCIIFGLLLYRSVIQDIILSVVPDAYHGVVTTLHYRANRTLVALYVTQALTALATFLIAAPVFWALGYSVPVTLAVLAGILQFLPVVGPSLLIVALAIFQVSQGAFGPAISVFLLGIILIGFIPDAVVRPHLARETADLPVSLYFVGFVGGLLTLGPIGVIAGPLVVALLIETIELLTTDVSSLESAGPI